MADGTEGRSGAVGPGATGSRFHVGITVPDAHSSPLHLGFAPERANVVGVLADFSFLPCLPEGGIITGPVFTDGPDLSAFSHVGGNWVRAQRAPSFLKGTSAKYKSLC